jgi:hypothetical protein
MKNCTIQLLLALCLLWNAAAAGATTSDNERLLRRLDSMIAAKDSYQSAKEAELSRLKQRLSATMNSRASYMLCDSLFREYLHYQADSAMAYINRKRALAAQLNEQDINDEIEINNAEALGVMGMYNEAFGGLCKLNSSSLSRKNRIYYYKTCRACYGWLSDYSLSVAPKEKYMKMTNVYRDSIVMAMEPGLERDIVWAEKLLLDGNPELALRKLTAKLDSVSDGAATDRQLCVYIYYTLSEVYRATNDSEKEIYWLTKTSIGDIESSTREYASLQRLAQLMYEKDDVKRAYSYLSRSMEDAVDCNARLRFIEVSQFFPIIDKAHNLEEAKDKCLMRTFLIVLSVLGVALIVVIFFLFRWMIRLKAIRRYLSETNRQMYDINKKLEETGKIKDVYIAKYLDRCASYLNKLDTYRHSLVKYAMASRVEELFKAIKSDEFINEERRSFYAEFDRTFLDLFPNFVEAFNALLDDDSPIIPKKDELLTTELRIFALIRLGVVDSSSIASFLGYSITTIYNYRSKVRSRAKGDKEQFEQRVMELFSSSL